MSGWDKGTANTSCLNLNPQMLKDTYDNQSMSTSGEESQSATKPFRSDPSMASAS